MRRRGRDVFGAERDVNIVARQKCAGLGLREVDLDAHRRDSGPISGRICRHPRFAILLTRFVVCEVVPCATAGVHGGRGRDRVRGARGKLDSKVVEHLRAIVGTTRAT